MRVHSGVAERDNEVQYDMTTSLKRGVTNRNYHSSLVNISCSCLHSLLTPSPVRHKSFPVGLQSVEKCYQRESEWLSDWVNTRSYSSRLAGARPLISAPSGRRERV
ncbi:hypothetical protein BaRGS_00031461 [Batillaria attramentaria]|uniref:Uncharacterized protein n=1 Tax=Batillaria attramentaria TaxID=370345 RepID=A0ABD0JQY0_9CAEN